MIATNVGNEFIVELLLDKGAEVNTKNKKGETALYLAVVHGHEEFQRRRNLEIIWLFQFNLFPDNW